MFKCFSKHVVLISLITLFLAGCCRNKPMNYSLQVTLHPQETSLWCWAASGQMVMDYLGHNVTQCIQANNRFGRTDCPCEQCTNSVANPPCVSGGWPEFDKYGFHFKTTSHAPLNWNQIRKQIYCSKMPFAFSWAWIGGGGHMMVARGYSTQDGINYVAILDPWQPCVGEEKIITYDEYNARLGDHTHWNDYYDIKYTGGN